MLGALIAIPAVTVAAPMSKVAPANPKLRVNCGTEKCRTTIFYGPYDDKSACKGASYCLEDRGYIPDKGYYCQSDEDYPILREKVPDYLRGKAEYVHHFKDSAVKRKLGKEDYRCLFCNRDTILECAENQEKSDLSFLRGGPEAGLLSTRDAIDEYRTRLREKGLKDDIFGNCISELCTREHMDIQDYSIYKE
jgi:hypothetical protein